MVDYYILTFSAVTVIATIWMGFRSAKQSKTASDFFVAGRSVSVGWNASAISGEYLSAASFMGVAGMVMSSGYDALWYPVCYACGYLFLLLFIAGPLRRFGAYTIPDFAEGRFDSPLFRKIAVIFVLFIGFFYTMPQMNGAGKTLAYVFQNIDLRGTWAAFMAPHNDAGQATKGFPYAAGVVIVGAVITLNVALGGMKGITLVQAFQYWAKMFAISVPVFVLMAVYGDYGKQLSLNNADKTAAIAELALPQAAPSIASPQSSQSFATIASTNSLDAAWKLNDARIARSPLPGHAPPDDIWLNPFGPLTTKAAKAAKLAPVQARPYSLLYTYSLIIALVCGTAGLPHILVRFYTNPDGVAAKRTTMWVMILIGVFYLFPPIFGVMGRNFLPELYAAGVGAKGTDKVVLELPRILNDRFVHFDRLGSALSGITCAGAFAAFMSTFSGLLVSMTGAMAHDVYGRILNPRSTPAQRLAVFKIFAVAIGAVAVLLGTFVETLEINFMVGQAFAIAAASYFPLLFVSVWWRRLTMKGAAIGMLAGGFSAVIAISLTSFSTLSAAPGRTGQMFAAFKPLNAFWEKNPLLRILCEQPALWAVPLAIGLMFVISRLTSRDIPADIRMKMLVLHAPEKLGLKQEYIQDHQSPAH